MKLHRYPFPLDFLAIYQFGRELADLLLRLLKGLTCLQAFCHFFLSFTKRNRQFGGALFDQLGEVLAVLRQFFRLQVQLFVRLPQRLFG